MFHNYVVSKEQMRMMDETTIKGNNITSYDLMSHAGRQIYRYITTNKKVTHRDNILIVAGTGNNGGDALVLAKHLLDALFNVDIYLIGDKKNQTYDSKKALSELPNAHWINSEEEYSFFKKEIKSASVIIDAIFGIGLLRDVEGFYEKVINHINKSDKYVISIDVPSGINADTGFVMNTAIKANETLVIQRYKYGNLLEDALDYNGKLTLLDIGIIDVDEENYSVLLSKDDFQFKPRVHNSHKYHYGSCLVIGGSKGIMGAPMLAAIAAYRSGAGLVGLDYDELYLPYVKSYSPDIMMDTFENIEELEAHLYKKTAVLFGPGLSKEYDKGHQILEMLLKKKVPLVIDADGLHYFKKFMNQKYDHPVIITPHIKEFARLFDLPTDEAKQNMFMLMEKLFKSNNVITILKGCATLIKGEKQYISILGNPGLATAGTGDVLAGIVMARLSRGIDPLQASKEGVIIHSLAAEHAKNEIGMESMIASDIIQYIKNVLNRKER